MDQDKRLHQLPPLQMRLSMRSDCPYISGRTEQRVAVDISENPILHDELARAGFRRVENWVYKPVCPQCQACLPWRVDTSRFQPGRNLSRIKRANRDLTRSVGSIRPTNEQYRLFLSYIRGRHGDGQMANMGRDDFIAMIENSPIETFVVNYRDDDGHLVGCVLADVQEDGLSAVYSFFDPSQATRSLGTFMILDLIDYAQERGMPWLYLGYYVSGSQKMMYKARFQPAQIYVDGRWRPYEGSD
ncbi:MAG: arginyltransferase [Candidatus Puniceispirillaceae bacterium]